MICLRGVVFLACSKFGARKFDFFGHAPNLEHTNFEACLFFTLPILSMQSWDTHGVFLYAPILGMPLFPIAHPSVRVLFCVPIF